MTQDPGYGQPGSTPSYGPPAGYGEARGPSGYGPPARARRNGLGVAALVLGILAVVCSITVVGGVLLGLLAIVLGALGRGRARRGEADNGGVALAGLLLGAVGLLLSVALIALGLSVLNSDQGQKLKDCLQNAQGDQAAITSCQQQFATDVKN